MEANISYGTITFALSIAGFLIITLFGVIAFFLKTLHGDVKKNIEDTGKNKGNIELIRQQQEADTKRIEAMTQLEIRVLSANVSDLSKNVNTLVTAWAKKGIDNEK